MRREELEIYSDATNLAVIRPPGRRFPGSVIQGDSLSLLVDSARSVARRIEELGIEDAPLREEVQFLQEELLDRLLHYQAALRKHGIRLPYGAPVSESDLVVLRTPREEG